MEDAPLIVPGCEGAVLLFTLIFLSYPFPLQLVAYTLTYWLPGYPAGIFTTMQRVPWPEAIDNEGEALPKIDQIYPVAPGIAAMQYVSVVADVAQTLKLPLMVTGVAGLLLTASIFRQVYPLEPQGLLAFTQRKPPLNFDLAQIVIEVPVDDPVTPEGNVQV
jgi:hypothetical protein